MSQEFSFVSHTIWKQSAKSSNQELPTARIKRIISRKINVTIEILQAILKEIQWNEMCGLDRGRPLGFSA